MLVAPHCDCGPLPGVGEADGELLDDGAGLGEALGEELAPGKRWGARRRSRRGIRWPDGIPLRARAGAARRREWPPTLSSESRCWLRRGRSPLPSGP